MIIKLLYGDGFFGRSYMLQVDNEYYRLGMILGSNSEEVCKSDAQEILKLRGIDYNLDNVNFEWDGTM